MPKVSPFPTGPQVGNRFGSSAAASSLKNMLDQRTLNATISRINETKAAFDAVPKEGERISSSLNEKGKTMAATGAERAQQLQASMEKTVGNLQRGTAKDMAGQAAMLQAHSQPLDPGGGMANPIDTGKAANSVEIGKGTNVNTQS
ncbi:MAG: hypothetical protein HZA01_04655 [Nitrospinae bacterium]|nr:hypothetical protein [Nitrospinota bacterium]